MGKYIKKENKQKVSNVGRSWATIVYPENAPERWQEKLDALLIPCVISPIHDKDIDEEGNPKKPHYHVLMQFGTPKSNLQVKDITWKFGGVGAELIKDMNASVQYLWHENHPQKAQYRKEKVKVMNGFDIEKYSITKRSFNDAFPQIIQIIELYDFLYFAQLVQYCTIHEKSLLQTVVSNSYAIVSYLKSREYMGKMESEQRGNSTAYQEM